jgi:hypothetical protein
LFWATANTHENARNVMTAKRRMFSNLIGENRKLVINVQPHIVEAWSLSSLFALSIAPHSL